MSNVIFESGKVKVWKEGGEFFVRGEDGLGHRATAVELALIEGIQSLDDALLAQRPSIATLRQGVGREIAIFE